MSSNHNHVDEYLKKKIEMQQKKRNYVNVHRRRLKRKRSLTSRLSFPSTTSMNKDQATDERNHSIQNEFRVSLFDQTSLLAPELENVLISDAMNSNSSNHSSDIDENIDEHIAFTVHSDERRLHALIEFTVFEFSTDILDFCRSSRLPNNQRSHILRLFRKYLPSPNLVPSSTEGLSAAVGIKRLHSTKKMCGSCYSLLSNGTCSHNHCINEGLKIASEDVVEIVNFDILEQLRLIINHNFKLLENYQQKARELTTDDSNDIVRGDVYQSLLQEYDSFFISIMMHSDGVPLYKSKNLSAWPMLGAVLEFPPYARTRHDNVIMFGVWIAKKKPDFEIIFQKLAENIHRAKNIGILANDGRRIRVLFPILMGDMPALSAMVNFVQPNSFYACMFCNIKGVYNHDGRCVTYPHGHVASLRTIEEFRACGLLATDPKNQTARDRTLGRKGVSCFENVLDISLPHSVVIDSMHTVFLCHAKKLLMNLVNFISKPNMVKISKNLRSIKFVHDILRRPRSLSNLHKWKASEIRLFILYIGLPILIEYLPHDVNGNLAMYVSIIRLMHDQWDSDVDLHKAISMLINLYLEDLTNKISEQNYAPNLLTITTHTHFHLPLQCKKFGRLNWLTNFVFESFLGFLKAFVKGSSGAGDQIAFGFESNFILSNSYGSNVLNSSCCDALFVFLKENNYISNETIIFSRLHHKTTTYHSFLYPRKGTTCSYLISYDNNEAIEYGFVICFLTFEKKCQAIVQKVEKVDRSITSYFQNYKHVNAIKNFIDEMYVVVKRTDPSVFNFDDTCLIYADQIRCRCFSVPFEMDLMILTDYACAFEHN